MAQAKKNQYRLSQILDILPIRFVIGGLFSIIVVALLMWGTQWKNWIDFPPRFNSLVAMSMIYVFTLVSIQRFSVYMGQLNLRYVFSVLVLWTVTILGLLFIFRLQYSVYFLVFSCLAMFVFFGFVAYIRSKYHHRVVAYIPKGRVNNLPELDELEWKALTDTQLIGKKQVDMVMADLRADLSDEWEQFLAQCTLRRIPVYHSGRLIEMVSGRVKIDHLYENELGSLLPSKAYLVIKRFFDIILILCSVPLVLPIMIITGVAIAIESRGGVFFLQERIGQGGVPFTMYKFRSMYTGTATDKTTGDSDSRITRIGKFIRKTRIDELPQFYNVLRGEMSLIGPRAEFHKFAEEYEKEIPFYSYRHIVKPGISGWAQVVHGYAADTEDTRVKLEHDFYYIKNFSFSLDLLIFFKTIQTMLTGFGAR